VKKGASVTQRKALKKRASRRIDRDKDAHAQQAEAPQGILGLQPKVGNRAVNRLIETHSAMRQVEQPPLEEDTPFDTNGLGKEEELLGHGNTGARQQENSPPDIQRQGGGSGPVAANMNLTSNPPMEMFLPEADIAATHGRPGVAGWTTPRYDIQVPRAAPNRVDINVTMDYDMELASEYSGDVLRVLRDHEFGHVNIGNQTAQQHLVNNLENGLERQSRLTPTSIQSAIETAANNFERGEGQGSQSYDAMDYPRMQQAYLGARTPLADLERASGNIANLARAFRTFNVLALTSPAAQIGNLAQDVLDARDGLSDDEVSRLQYNAEFKAILATCRGRISEIIRRFQWNFWIFEFSLLDQNVRNKLDELSAVLGDFTWLSPV
jgi:hypothetical protein